MTCGPGARAAAAVAAAAAAAAAAAGWSFPSLKLSYPYRWSCWTVPIKICRYGHCCQGQQQACFPLESPQQTRPRRGSHRSVSSTAAPTAALSSPPPWRLLAGETAACRRRLWANIVVARGATGGVFMSSVAAADNGGEVTFDVVGCAVI